MEGKTYSILRSSRKTGETTETVIETGLTWEVADSTRTSHGAGGLVQPFVTKYYGTALANSIDEPLDTVTTKQRFGLVQPEWNGYRLDIRFRMLQPHELAAASSFPPEYPFVGTKSDVVKQIGNAVPPLLAQALIFELLKDYQPAKKATVTEFPAKEEPEAIA